MGVYECELAYHPGSWCKYISGCIWWFKFFLYVENIAPVSALAPDTPYSQNPWQKNLPPCLLYVFIWLRLHPHHFTKASHWGFHDPSKSSSFFPGSCPSTVCGFTHIDDSHSSSSLCPQSVITQILLAIPSLPLPSSPSSSWLLNVLHSVFCQACNVCPPLCFLYFLLPVSGLDYPVHKVPTHRAMISSPELQLSDWPAMWQSPEMETGAGEGNTYSAQLSHTPDHAGQVRQAREDWHAVWESEELSLGGWGFGGWGMFLRSIIHSGEGPRLHDLDFSPDSFPFTPRTGTPHVQTWSYISFVKPEAVSQSCAAGSLKRDALEDRDGQIPPPNDWTCHLGQTFVCLS